ncbi:MAG: YciI family protein [Rhodospirillales bacterium]
MYFVITCTDKPGQPELRSANRGDHIEYLKSHADKILCAGPTLGEDDTPNGSLLIMNFEDVQAAQDFAVADPYSKAGVFETVGITPWKKVFPKD